MKAAESFSLFKLYTTTAGFSSGGAPPATGGVRHPKAPRGDALVETTNPAHYQEINVL